MMTSFYNLTGVCFLIFTASVHSTTGSNYELNLRFNDDNPSEPQKHLRLPLIAKALNKIVISTCPLVNPTNLASFYAYLNRQLDESVDPTFVDPQPFTDLYNNIAFCSEYLENLIPQSPTLTTADKHAAITPKFTVSTPSQINTSPAGSDITVKPTPQPKTTNKPVDILTQMPYPLDFESNSGRNEPKEFSTVIDKIAYNTSVITGRLVSNVFSSIQVLYTSAARWWGRSKREVSESSLIKPIYYSKLYLPVQTNDKNSYQQSLGLSWKRKQAYFHLVQMLKSVVTIAVSGCPSNFEISKRHLTMVCKLMATQVLKDLAQLEASGAYINVSEDLLEEVNHCINKWSKKYE